MARLLAVSYAYRTEILVIPSCLTAQAIRIDHTSPALKLLVLSGNLSHFLISIK